MNSVSAFLEYLDDFNTVSIIVRLVLAALFGGIIGIEREQKRHSAGFRTFTLVCIGSALGTIANIYLCEVTGSADTSRIAAGVVSGIGFIGVGTILVTPKNRVKGLTTAAGLWTTGCLGIALGAGMIFTSVVSFVIILFTMSVLSKLSGYIKMHNHMITLYVEVEKEEDLDRFITFAKEHHYTILSMEKNKEKITKSHLSVVLEMDLRAKLEHTQVVHTLGKIEGVFYIEEV